jgi:1-aminocyclopropane-1-carboxylate deaminase/D-cysteine desulfhydrase-like pyridoxal-dependent ACC family enzyme
VDLLVPSLPTPLLEISDEVTCAAGIRLFIKRDDLIHHAVSGNKLRKLKYNLLEALEQGQATLLTFGGAYSNHLYALAAAGNALGFETIGIVRGEDHESRDTPTLQFCQEQGMKIHFVSRQEYRQRNDPDYLGHIKSAFGKPYIIPEGGTTVLALPGVAEMVNEIREQLGFFPDYFAVAAGTGGILSAGEKVLAFSALKGGAFLAKDIEDLIESPLNTGALNLFTDYHFGGYAKWNSELIDFINEFRNRHGISLEQVYTGKMLYGLYDLIKKSYFPKDSTIVAVHTGGLQGLLPSLK